MQHTSINSSIELQQPSSLLEKKRQQWSAEKAQQQEWFPFGTDKKCRSAGSKKTHCEYVDVGLHKMSPTFPLQTIVPERLELEEQLEECRLRKAAEKRREELELEQVCLERQVIERRRAEENAKELSKWSTLLAEKEDKLKSVWRSWQDAKERASLEKHKRIMKHVSESAEKRSPLKSRVETSTSRVESKWIDCKPTTDAGSPLAHADSGQLSQCVRAKRAIAKLYRGGAETASWQSAKSGPDSCDNASFNNKPNLASCQFLKKAVKIPDFGNSSNFTITAKESIDKDLEAKNFERMLQIKEEFAKQSAGLQLENLVFDM